MPNSSRSSGSSPTPSSATETTSGIVGDLTVKGSTEPVELSGRMSGPITDGFGNERIGLDLETVINRHAFGVSWNADLPGGGRMLEDDVTITANLTLIRK